MEASDRISRLTDDILHIILSFLETTEVVQTCLVSKRWKNLWKSIPSLSFDQNIRDIGPIGSLGFEFENFIENVLVFRDQSSDIRYLRILSDDECDLPTVYWWLQVASKRNVRELEASLELFETDESMSPLVFFKSLVSMQLNMNYARVPIVLNCGNLKSLHLVSVRFPSEEFVRGICEGNPLLESLSIHACVIGRLRVVQISGSNLKDFSFANTGMGVAPGCHGSFEGVLNVSAPKLLYFEYLGPVLGGYSLQELSSLESAFVRFVGFREQKQSHLLCEMIKGFYNATRLRLSISPREYDSPSADEPQCFPTMFHNLKCLELRVCFLRHHLLGLVHILNHCPKLEALIIDAEKYVEKQDTTDPLYPEYKIVPCLTDTLRRVEINYSKGVDYEFEFLKFLLNNGNVLEEVAITWSKNLESKARKFQQVFEFPKAAPNVVISFPKRSRASFSIEDASLYHEKPDDTEDDEFDEEF